MFNVVGTVIFVVLCMVTPFVDWMITTNPANPAAQIANVHTIFNIATTVILFPFGPMLVNIAKKILPDTQVKHVMDADQWFEGLMLPSIIWVFLPLPSARSMKKSGICWL